MKNIKRTPEQIVRKLANEEINEMGTIRDLFAADCCR